MPIRSLKAALRRVRPQRPQTATAIAEIDLLRRTFSSLELSGPAPVKSLSGAFVRLASNGQRPIEDIVADGENGRYHLVLPLEELAEAHGECRWTMTLVSDGSEWALGRTRSDHRGPVTMPVSVFRLGERLLRARVTSTLSGALALHTRAWVDAT